MRAHLPLRLIRTAAFAAVCVILAAGAHALGGGSRPGSWAAGPGLGGVFVLALILSARERSTGVVNTALVVSQLGLHELFGGGDGTGYVAVHLHGQGLGDALGMLLAHLTATILTGCLLARGEAALWAVLRRLTRRLVLLPRPAAVPPKRSAAPVRPVPVRPTRAGSFLRHSVTRRGPPLPA